MQLELWLDESGDFTSDHKPHLNPSLVGGVLIEKGQITENKARQITGKDYVHFNEEKGMENLKLLEQLKQLQAELVIFQNKERLMIIDSDTTYLNVLAEGIIQLLLQLSANYGDFQLDITVATRKNTVQGYGIISEEQYERRLRERIILGLARKALTRKNKWVYTIHFDDARTSKKLMLADGVCNTYLTRTSSKFDVKQKARIEELYDDTYIFSFYENIIENDLKRWLAEGKLSDVIFECYIEESLDNRDTLLNIALKRLSDLDPYGQRLQLLDISSKVETFVKIDRSYHLIRPVLLKFQQELIPRLKELDVHVPEFNLDIILYLYTLYTHEGNIEAEQQDKLFLAELKYVDDMMVKFDYFNKYKLRKTIHQKNMFNILGSIDDVSKVISVFEEMMEMHELLVEETGNDQDTTLMFDALGKAYGSRGQGYTMLIHKDQAYLELAIADFDRALKHFSYDRDKERQYLYKCLAYCEGDQFDKAVANLKIACQVETDGFEQLVRSLQEQELAKTIFKYHSYFKIMADAKEASADNLADDMYDALLKENVNVQTLAAKCKDAHPIQFITWNMARYLRFKGKHKQGMRYLDQAIEICDVELHQATIKVIQLGIYADKALVLENQGKKREAEQVEETLLEQWMLLKQSSDNQTIVKNLEHMNMKELNQIAEFARSIN